MKKKGTSKSSSKNWIQSAIKKPGSLRKALGVKKGEKIPVKKLDKAASQRTKSGSMTKLAKRASLAKTLRKLDKKK